MKTYVWTINDAAYPNRDSLDLRAGERVEIDLSNTTSMAHPMHLHGHDFEVLKVDGEQIAGALRGTIVVPPGSKITVGFDADNAGIWAFHCHLIYHLVTGIFTVLKYDGANVQFWQPEKQISELKNQLEPFTTPRPFARHLILVLYFSRRGADNVNGKRDLIGDLVEELP